MCEQCCAETINLIRNILPGWHLCKATKQGSFMQPEDYGLLMINDPDFIFSVTPIKNPLFKMSDEQFNALAENNSIWKLADKFDDIADQMIGQMMNRSGESFDDIRKLIKAGEQAGYDENKHNVFGYWLAHRIAVALENIK